MFFFSRTGFVPAIDWLSGALICLYQLVSKTRPAPLKKLIYAFVKFFAVSLQTNMMPDSLNSSENPNVCCFVSGEAACMKTIFEKCTLKKKKNNTLEIVYCLREWALALLSTSSICSFVSLAAASAAVMCLLVGVFLHVCLSIFVGY